MRNGEIAELNDPVGDGAEAEQTSLYPYDRRTMTYPRLRVTNSGQYILETRRVARTYYEAMMTRKDYYHPGGTLYGKDDEEVGSHPAGWLVDGHKWRTDRNPDDGLNLEISDSYQLLNKDEAEKIAALQR